MMTTIPASYARAASGKLVGCLVYLVVAPFVALFLTLFISVPLMCALEALGYSRETAKTPFVVMLPLIGLGVAIWGYREYRHRAGLKVVIDRDRVLFGRGRSQKVLRFEDVASIRLAPTESDFACILKNRSGKALRLPPELAPLAKVHDPLEITLIPEMVRRLDDRLARGEAVVVRIPTVRLLVLMCRGLGALFVGVLLVAKPWTIPKGLLVLRHAALIHRQVRLGMNGGLVLEREGLRRFSRVPAPLTTWDQLERVQSDPVGLVLRSTTGEVLTISVLADDFWPALRLINARVKRGV